MIDLGDKHNLIDIVETTLNHLSVSRSLIQPQIKKFMLNYLFFIVYVSSSFQWTYLHPCHSLTWWKNNLDNMIMQLAYVICKKPLHLPL